jgi:two-component system, LuxR family, sensor kinase FixL
MSWITIVWSMDAAVCFTLAGIYLLVWWKQREGRVYLLFSCSAVAAGVIAGFELASMRAETTAQYGALMRWAHLPVWMLVVSVVWFVRLYLRAGRPWLAWSVCGLRTLALVLNFLFTPNLNYREITSLGHVSWWGGETVSAPIGVPNAWTLVGELGLLLLIIFFVDATITAWRRGDRGRALVVGGSAIAFTALALGQSALVIWGAIESPFFVSFPYLGIIAAMGYELSSDVLRAAQLARQLQASEADLRETEQRMELAASAADLGMWVWDIERNEVWITDRRRVLFGFAPSEQLDIERLRNLVHPEDRESVRVALENALNIGAEYETDYRVVLPDGQVRWMAGRGRVEFNREGKPVRMRGVSLDITERWHAEQELQQLRQEIAHVSRVSMMGQLASALAHEINQPLGAILRNAEAAELFIRHESPDLNEIRAILTDIRKDDQRASAVISRMRALLKGHSLDTRPIDVGEFIGEVAALARADAAARHVKLETNVSLELPAVNGDRVHLQQVLLNLILNGMDALDGTTQNDRRVTVGARLDGPQSIEIAVSDTGSGIPADELAHVFEPFFTTKPDGMGMGLPISRTIIEAHGGRLWAENNNGGGATFRFTLRAAKEAGAT